jgi:hypothetical protein
MRTLIRFVPAFNAATGTSNRAGGPPRVGGAPLGAAIFWPFTHTSTICRMSPNVRLAPCVALCVASGISNVRVNQTTPSKLGRPFVSQAPGCSISFQSAVSDAASGSRQSGLLLPRRSASGSAVSGTAFGSARYSVRNVSLWRDAAM